MRKAAATETAFLLLPVLTTLLCTLPLGSSEYSHVRIVRLSYVEGDVSVIRPQGAGRTRGLTHLPLAHDAVVETTNGIVEIEFEEGTVARLAPGSRLHLAELGLREGGERATRLSLEEGTASFRSVPRPGDTFIIGTPHFQVTAAERAQFRIEIIPEGSRIRVFRGTVSVEGGWGTIQVAKGQLFEWRPTLREILLTRDQETDAWDAWNLERDRVVPSHSYYPYSSSYWYLYSHRYFSNWYYPTYWGTQPCYPHFYHSWHPFWPTVCQPFVFHRRPIVSVPVVISPTTPTPDADDDQAPPPQDPRRRRPTRARRPNPFEAPDEVRPRSASSVSVRSPSGQRTASPRSSRSTRQVSPRPSRMPTVRPSSAPSRQIRSTAPRSRPASRTARSSGRSRRN
jgi:hypothetical protein